MLIFPSDAQAPGSSAILDSTSVSERAFLFTQKHSNLNIFAFDFKGLKKRRCLFLTWIDLFRIVTHLPGSGAGSCDWSMVRIQASDWLAVSTHLPAVSGRKKVAAAPTMEQRPRMSSGRTEEKRAWGQHGVKKMINSADAVE